MSSPTQRSLAYLREQGYTCDIVEHFNSFTKQRKDLFNVIDILAIRKGEILGVQTTARSSVSARVKKIAECEYVPAIRESGMRLEVHGWGKVSDGKYKNGKPKHKWACRIVDLS